MKKTLAILLALAMIISLAACGGSGNSSTGTKTEQKPVKTVLTKTTTYEDGKAMYTVSYEYDEYGFETHMTYEYPEKDFTYEYFNENSYGDDYLASVRNYDPDDSYFELYEFNNEGKLIRMTREYKEYPDANVIHEYRYDNLGLCSGYDITRPDKEQTEEYYNDLIGINFVYNDDATLSSKQYVYYLPSHSLLETYRYENNGKRQTSITYYGEGDHTITGIKVREYDDNGNIITETSYQPAISNKKLGEYYVPYQDYYKEGFQPDLSRYFKSEETISTYDADGKLTNDIYSARYINSFTDPDEFYDGYTINREYEYEDIEVKTLLPELYIPEE